MMKRVTRSKTVRFMKKHIFLSCLVSIFVVLTVTFFYIKHQVSLAQTATSDWDDNDEMVPDLTNWQKKDEEEEEIKIFDELSEKEVRLNREIFYLVSSGYKDLTLREACAVESAAKWNPSRRIFVIFLTKDVVDVFKSKSLSALLSYENIYIRHIRLKKYIVHPESKNWFVNSDFHKTDFHPEFLNDALTYVMLEKFGGTVLDFDSIVLKQIPYEQQFFSRNEEDQIASRPISLNSRHGILDDIQRSLSSAFSADDAHSIGGPLISSVLKRECQVDFIKELLFKDCLKSAKILSVDSTCPIPGRKAKILFDPTRTELALRQIESVDPMLVKLWAEKSVNQKSWGSKQSKTAFFRLAENQCLIINQVLGSGNYQ